jgi:hypothetical protein
MHDTVDVLHAVEFPDHSKSIIHRFEVIDITWLLVFRKLGERWDQEFELWGLI